MQSPSNLNATHTALSSEITIMYRRVLDKLRRDFPATDEEDRKDVMQDAWLKMVEHHLLCYLDIRGLGLKWLYNVAKNRLLNKLRDHRDLRIPKSMEVSINDEGINAVETRDLYLKILANLKPHEKPIFIELCKGLDIKEAAQSLNIKLDAAYKQRKRAEKRIRRFFLAK